MDAAVLVPVKDFRQAKARLAAVMSVDDRIHLARWTAQRVVAAAAPLPVFVACDDDDVAEWAQGHGATVLWRPAMGLNAAVADGIASVGAAGIEHVVIAHSDLAHPAGLTEIVLSGGIVLVPDARSDGTNVIATPTGIGFEVSYGPQSFRRHVDHALSLGVAVRVRRDTMLARDIDTPADLAHPMIAPLVAEVNAAWAPTNPDNR